MISDFPPFLLSNLMLFAGIFTMVFQACLIIYGIERFCTKKNFIDTLPQVPDWLLIVTAATNAVFMLVSFPVSDVGANCWDNCFHFTNIGLTGYIANYLSLILAVIMVILVVVPQLRSWKIFLPLAFAYGISMFLHMAFLDKGLWCICRSSGFMYLWNSFVLILAIGWITYFATVIILYLKAFEIPQKN